MCCASIPPDTAPQVGICPFFSVFACLLGDSGQCVGLPELPLLSVVLCGFSAVSFIGLLRGLLHLCFCGFFVPGVLNWSTAQVTLSCVVPLRLVALIGLLRR